MSGSASFLAIDFETASSSPDSACSVGIALVDQGAVVDTGHELIDPGLAAEAWNPFNIRVHGIEPDQVAGARGFGEVWLQLQADFAGLPMVAHNAAFDMGVIRASLASRAIVPADELRYLCSVRISRAAWPDMRSVRLNLIAERLGLELDHHNAESDARACAEVTLHALDRLGASGLDELVAERGWRWNRLG